MTTESEREKHRRPTGQFGQHEHTEPEQSLISPPPKPLLVIVPGAALHEIEERGLFGRTRTKSRTIDTALRVYTESLERTEIGERGERIIDGQAYLPALRDGEHAPADEEALATLGKYAAVRLPKLTGTVEQATRQADHHLNQHPRPGVIIDGMLWVRSSEAAHTHF